MDFFLPLAKSFFKCFLSWYLSFCRCCLPSFHLPRSFIIASNTVLTIDDNIKNTTSYAHGRISGWLPSPRPSGAPRGPGSLHANCFFGTLINCNLAREFAPSCLALWSFLGTSFSFILCKYNVYYKQNCALLHQNKTTIKIYSSSTGCSGLNRT